jgi:hypothetical protein
MSSFNDDSNSNDAYYPNVIVETNTKDLKTHNNNDHVIDAEIVIRDTPSPKNYATRKYRDTLSLFPQGILFFCALTFIATITGMVMSHLAIIPLRIEGAFWSGVLLVVLNTILFLCTRLTNFPVLCLASLYNTTLACLWAHIYTFISYISVAQYVSNSKTNSIIQHLIDYIFFYKLNTNADKLQVRSLYEWPLIFIQLVVLIICGSIAPFCVFMMYQCDDTN